MSKIIGLTCHSSSNCFNIHGSQLVFIEGEGPQGKYPEKGEYCY